MKVAVHGTSYLKLQNKIHSFLFISSVQAYLESFHAKNACQDLIYIKKKYLCFEKSKHK